MNSSLKRIRVGVVCFALIFTIAVAGYMAAGWSLIDAIYMVVITVFGVGFGEIGPMSPLLRVFTIFVIVAGYTAVAYIVGGFLQLITEGEINRALGTRRMKKEISALSQHVLICGYGRIGQILAQQLATSGHPFVVIDSSLDRLETAQELGYLVCHGSATDEEVLEAAGIHRAKALSTVLPDDAANVFITLTARSLNPQLVILARGEFPSTEKKLRRAGADHVVLPATIGALRMAHIITHPAALAFMDQNDERSNINELLAQINMQLDEFMIPPGSPIIGMRLSELMVRGKRNFILVALRRADGETIINPSDDVFSHEGDTLILMGHKGDIPKIARDYALKRQLQYRGAKSR
jgi:voltage-gated potassium channel